MNTIRVVWTNGKKSGAEEVQAETLDDAVWQVACAVTETVGYERAKEYRVFNAYRIPVQPE